MNNAIKIAAIGGAGFLLYQYFAGTAATPKSSTTPDSSAPPAPPPQTPAIITDVQLKRAAANKDWAYEAGNTQRDWHQWNWYRRAYNASLPAPAPEDVGQGDGSATITAAQYHAVLNAAGLAGLALRGALLM